MIHPQWFSYATFLQSTFKYKFTYQYWILDRQSGNNARTTVNHDNICTSTFLPIFIILTKIRNKIRTGLVITIASFYLGSEVMRATLLNTDKTRFSFFSAFQLIPKMYLRLLSINFLLQSFPYGCTKSRTRPSVSVFETRQIPFSLQ